MNNINFNTSNSTFRQLMGSGMRYHVPRFQRDYSWGEDEWDDLWQDITILFSENDDSVHYMGYLVLQSSDNKMFDIIDGQQRITTISIIILSGLYFIKKLIDDGIEPENNIKRQEQLRNSYIGYLDPVTLVPQSKLELNRHNDKFYQNYLVTLDKLPSRGLNASEHQLRKAFLWFCDKYDDCFVGDKNNGKAIAGFIDRIVDKLFFTVITVTDELNAFKVFETLNARGVRLSATDLLKNYLFSLIGSDDTHDIEIKTLEDIWERIIGLLGSESFPEFLRIFWNSTHKLVRKAELFKAIKKNIDSKELAFRLIRELDSSASIYSAIRDCFDSTWNSKEKDYLWQLSLFSVRQPLSMLLSCYNVFFDKDRNTFDRILKATVIISFRYNVICGLIPNIQEGIYNDIAQKVYSGELNSYKEIINALLKVYPSDDQFKNLFINKELKTTNTRNKKIVRYILSKIEKHLSNKELDFESDSYGIEHILPENPSIGWNYIPESKQEDLIYRIGNMTLLETSYNKKIGNKEYKEKRIVYSNSNYAITTTIPQYYEIWDEKKIVSRQTKLAESAVTIWRLNNLT